MPYPARLGDPCWDPAQVGKVITVNAQTSAASVDYFLAAHSPFRFISNASQINAEVTEEQVYEDIFSSGRREVQAAIRGEPGTGKSHLVHWLKLRADQAAADGDKRLAKFVRVLVQRGNGSLKDALEQIVSQLVAELGPDFLKHLERVQNALEKLSETTARAKLLAELTLEIENRWTERGRPPLAPGTALLGEALRANGVRNHLLRAGGTIDQVVRILTEASSWSSGKTSTFSARRTCRNPSGFCRGKTAGRSRISSRTSKWRRTSATPSWTRSTAPCPTPSAS